MTFPTSPPTPTTISVENGRRLVGSTSHMPRRRRPRLGQEKDNKRTRNAGRHRSMAVFTGQSTRGILRLYIRVLGLRQHPSLGSVWELSAGSIPATSTHGCCRIGTPSDLETPQGSCPAGFLAVPGLAFGVASAVLRSYPPPCSAPPRCGRVAGRHRRPATASGWGCQSGGLAVPSTVGLTGSTTSAQCSAAFGRLPNPAQRSRSAHTARRASGS